MKSFFISDNVCVPYKLILHKVSDYLVANGMTPSSTGDSADLYIVGLCGAFHSLEEEALSFLQRAKETNAYVVAFGCLARINPERVKELSPDKIITAPRWEDFESILPNAKVKLDSIPMATEFRSKEEYRLYDPSKVFVLVQTGCNADCPFCPHKLGIGQLRSRPMKDILYEIEQEKNRGVKTVVLHGNDTGSYGVDLAGLTFPILLGNVLEISPDVHLTQVNSNWAHEYRDSLFPLLRHPRIKEFQAPIQSVSERVLRLMNRKPVVRELYPYFKALRNDRPDIFLRTDIILGYPTATEEEEHETLVYVTDLFDEVAVHGFERFDHAPLEKMGLPFYSSEEISDRVKIALEYFSKFPKVLVHRGGQIYKTMVDGEQPKAIARASKQINISH